MTHPEALTPEAARSLVCAIDKHPDCDGNAPNGPAGVGYPCSCKCHAERAARQTPDTSGLRELFARYIEHHGEPAEWDTDDGWCRKHLPAIEDVRAALAAYDASIPTTHSDTHSEPDIYEDLALGSRAHPLDVTTLVTDTATGDQWRVPTRAVEAIVAALDAVRPGLDAMTLAVAINDAQFDPSELRLGRDLLPVAERILAALGEDGP